MVKSVRYTLTENKRLDCLKPQWLILVAIKTDILNQCRITPSVCEPYREEPLNLTPLLYVPLCGSLLKNGMGLNDLWAAPASATPIPLSPTLHLPPAAL